MAIQKRYNLTIPLNLEEHVILITEAEKSSLSRAEYARRRIFGRRVVARVPMTDANTITLLKQLCGIVKQLYASERVSPGETQAMLAQAKKLLHRIQIGILHN